MPPSPAVPPQEVGTGVLISAVAVPPAAKPVPACLTRARKLMSKARVRRYRRGMTEHPLGGSPQDFRLWRQADQLDDAPSRHQLTLAV
jgi:hypothetical protein